MFLAQIKMKLCFLLGTAVLLSMCVAATVEAKKPGGGSHPPAGDVYFDYYFGDYNSGPSDVMAGVVMDAAGKNPVFGVAGTPSYEPHDGHRWFLQYVAANPTQNKIVAVRDDGALTVPLTHGSSFGIMYHEIPPPWVPGSGDQKISFLGYDSVNDQQGVFTVPVDFSSGVPVAGAPTLAWSIPKMPYDPPQAPGPRPDAESHSWSADGTWLLYDRSSQWASYLVTDLAAGTETYLGAGLHPSLSPEGTTVAYRDENNSLATVGSDGTGEVVLVEGGGRGGTYFFNDYPLWSPDPDSNHIIFRHKKLRVQPAIRTTDDIWRVNRDGSGVVNLTRGVENGVFPTAWRADSAGMASVPEPGSLVLLGLGFAALFGFQRRRTRCLARNERVVGRIQTSHAFTVATAVLLTMVVAVNAEAKKPGGHGGGPHPPTPPGNIYMDFWNSASGQYEGIITDGDGNNAVFGAAGTPSYELHNGHRWFLQYGENEIIAVRDGLPGSVPLINDASFGIIDHVIPPPWVPGTGDTEVSFLGYDSVNDMQGVFTVPISFAGGVPNATDEPALTWSIPKYISQGQPTQLPDARSHSWSADGTQLLYDNLAQLASYLVEDLATGGTETHLGAGIHPSLAPDGTAVAYMLEDFSLATVGTDGTGEAVLVESESRGRWSFHNKHPIWSPDSDHIIYQRRGLRSWGSLPQQIDDVWRVNRDGSRAVNLTDWTDDDVIPTAWRLDSGMPAAVPEPASLVLLGLGLHGWVRCQRRRREK